MRGMRTLKLPLKRTACYMEAFMALYMAGWMHAQGTLLMAMANGLPVVSTPYHFALELLQVSSHAGQTPPRSCGMPSCSCIQAERCSN